MKEFNLEKAKNGAAVCMKDGTPVKILDFELLRPDGLEIVYKYKDDYGRELLAFTDNSGKSTMVVTEEEGYHDLFMAPTVGYMCIYKLSEETLAGGTLRATLEECASDRELLKDNFDISVFRCYAKVELLDD